jgi:transposase
MGIEERRRALQKTGLVHPCPLAVTAPLFDGSRPFFLAEDKAQVKYEMLRAHIVDGRTVRVAAEEHGYCRAAYYLIAAAFEAGGMRGLFDEPRGRKGPLRVTPEIVAFLAEADPGLSGVKLAEIIRERFGVGLHRRTVERARGR